MLLLPIVAFSDELAVLLTLSEVPLPLLLLLVVVVVLLGDFSDGDDVSGGEDDVDGGDDDVDGVAGVDLPRWL